MFRTRMHKDLDSCKHIFPEKKEAQGDILIEGRPHEFVWILYYEIACKVTFGESVVRQHMIVCVG